MKILISGGTGFIGKSLVDALLQQGHEIILLARRPEKILPQNGLKPVAWDGKQVGDWAAAAQGADAVINLAGEGIADQRWSARRKKELTDSRIFSTRALTVFIRNSPKKPAVFINASAVGYYGNVLSGDVTENSPKGRGFLADLCEQWENEARLAESAGVRTVLLRTGIVLEKGGGALAKMLFPFRIFAGGPLGSGQQWFPWVHREDVTGAILFSLDHSNLSGPVNMTAPNPVTMKEFCSQLGHVLHRPSWAPVPAFALKIILGEMAEMLLEGQKAVPQKLTVAGYRFRYTHLYEALTASLK